MVKYLDEQGLKTIDVIDKSNFLDEVDSMRVLVVQIIHGFEDVEREGILKKPLVEDIIRGFLTYNVDTRSFYDGLIDILQTSVSAKGRIPVDLVEETQKDIGFYHEFTDWLDEVLSVLSDNDISDNEYVMSIKKDIYDLMVGHENSLIPLIETFNGIEV